MSGADDVLGGAGAGDPGAGHDPRAPLLGVEGIQRAAERNHPRPSHRARNSRGCKMVHVFYFDVLYTAAIGGGMITEKMRVLSSSPRGVDIAKAYLRTIEDDDVAGLERLMRPDVRLKHANYPTVQGRDEALALIAGYRRIVGGVEFEVRTLLGTEGVIAIEKVNVAKLERGALARIPGVTILEFGDDALISWIRVYADIADLFRKIEAVHAFRTP